MPLQQTIEKVWQFMQAEPDDELVDLVRQRIYDLVDIRPDQEQVVEVLRGSRDQPSKPYPLPAHPWEKPTGYRLWGKPHYVRSWIEILMGVAEALYKRHGTAFLDRLLDPLGPQGGQRYASYDPDDLRRPKQLMSTGVYIEADLLAEQIYTRIYQCLFLCGHSCSDIKIHT